MWKATAPGVIYHLIINWLFIILLYLMYVLLSPRWTVTISCKAAPRCSSLISYNLGIILDHSRLLSSCQVYPWRPHRFCLCLSSSLAASDYSRCLPVDLLAHPLNLIHLLHFHTGTGIIFEGMTGVGRHLATPCCYLKTGYQATD